MIYRFLICCAILASLLSCQEPKKAAPVTYASSIPPVSMILYEIVKGRAEIVTLLQNGASPHTFEPTPQLVAKAGSSKALFWVGKGLDPWAEKLAGPQKISLLALVDKRMLLSNQEDSQLSPDDPHFWLDPLVVKSIVPSLVAKLIELDPEGKAVYEANASVLTEKLSRLDATVGSILRRTKGKSIVLIHPSMQYLATRYGIKIAAVVETVPGKEPTVASLSSILQKAQNGDAKALFTEPQLPQREAEQIAEATKLPLGTLDPIGGIEGRDTYESLILYNAKELMSKL